MQTFKTTDTKFKMQFQIKLEQLSFTMDCFTTYVEVSMQKFNNKLSIFWVTLRLIYQYRNAVPV